MTRVTVLSRAVKGQVSGLSPFTPGSSAMPDVVDGECDARLEEVRELLNENIAYGKEVGVSLAVDLRGESVLDLWGGHRDAAKTMEWTRDTIVNVWSSTKMVTNLAALMLADRGLLDVHAPVARYWPEFAAQGKSHIEVRHLMSHTSGLSGWDGPVVTEDLYDLPGATARLARQVPWWPPGTASGYHSNSQGHLIGELVRRVSGLSLTEFIRTEIAAPLGADFQIGVRPDDDARVAEIIPPPPYAFDFAAADPDDIMVKTFARPLIDAATANTRAWRRAELGAVNGHGNARSLSRILSAVSAGGSVGGVRLLRPSTIDLIFEEQAHGVDLVLGLPMRWGIGYARSEPQSLPYIDQGRTCFWGGWGGSLTVMHPDRGLTISYVMNQMSAGVIGSERSAEYVTAIYQALG
ncbi:serine hydrolase domain-containing protein [Streptomyces sp. NPDC056296]|uniref:serine hydrolase domain-containing protein n=1 Tax=Streptomyces sp. NPDC056296 TaxID=3345775 RepID=UPI0035DA9B55